MANIVSGDTSSLKPAQARALARLGERTVPAAQLISQPLARDLLDLSHELNRQIGLYIDRRGRVVRVILGDAHSMQLPPAQRARGVEGRLSGLRLVATHLVADALTREELADLVKLRLDILAVVFRGPSGLTVEAAGLVPGEHGDAAVARTFPRVALSVLLREGDAPDPSPELPAVFDEWLRATEGALVDATTAARAQAKGIRAMALVVHPGAMPVARRHELSELTRTAGIALVEVVTQRRPFPDPRTFFGVGKLREVLIRALEQDVELLICDPELTPSQAREIATMTDLKVIDRTILILDIFAQHAKSTDGKLQVELAQQRYRLPRLAGKGTMMSRLAGGIGGRGPGETKLEIDRRRAKDRIAELERRLKQMRAQREQRRATRTRSGVPVVAIVGYTNAGKSTLLNTITRSDVRAEDKLFATLDPTVRRIRFPHDREIVLLDTVGFIRDLPPALMQAFSATLEEIAGADLVLHVVDATDPDKDQHIEAVEHILGQLDAAEVPRLLVYNKCDTLETPPACDGVTSFAISALDRRSTRALMEAVEARFFARGPDATGEVLAIGVEASAPDGEGEPGPRDEPTDGEDSSAPGSSRAV